ncbi:MAG: hypothetical protein NTV15_03175 [Candidatus Bathyarchaeota archaeon]|nr:hypothetical protein [Candidatus Bathyarchaeota archaeon]
MANDDQRVAPRQILRLEQMTESSKREAASYGLAKIAENVRSLLSEVNHIENTAPRASTILTHIAAEEAGKGFMIVDYMRPYRNVSLEMRSRHLKNVYSHLSRGIYVKYYESRPDTFREVQSIVKGYRVSHYLDGPNDVDWILRNEIEEERERELYVDLVSDEEGIKWHSPTDWWKRYSMVRDLTEFAAPRPPICALFLLMQEVGLFSEKALAIMAKTWKDVSVSSTTRWGDYLIVNQAFIKECKAKVSFTSGTTSETLDRITDEFLYPLCGLDLQVVQVTADELQERRERRLRFIQGE